MVLVSGLAKGQTVNLYPESYASYFYNFALINPAHVSREGKAEFVGGFKQRTGPFRKVSTYSVTAEKVFRNENEAAHTMRLVFFNEREGPYIQRPRASFNYAYMLPVYDDTYLMAGASFGFAQVSFTAPTATGAGSSVFPDANLGLILRRKALSAGVASFQVLNAESSPVAGNLRLNRYYTYFISAELDVSPDLKLTTYSLYRALSEYPDDFDIAAMATVRELFSFGSIARINRGLSFLISVQPDSGDNKPLFSFLYNSPFMSQTPQWFNSFELVIGYRFN